MIIPLVYFPGTPEVILIVVAILLLFGGKKIPELMKGLGTGIREFKKGVSEGDENLKEITKDEDKKEK